MVRSTIFHSVRVRLKATARTLPVVGCLMTPPTSALGWSAISVAF